MSISKELSLVPLAQINQVLAVNGLGTFTDKNVAIGHLTSLINSGAATIDQVKKAVPTATTAIASGVPQDVRDGLLKAQSEIHSAVEQIRNVQEQVASAVLDVEHNRITNDTHQHQRFFRDRFGAQLRFLALFPIFQRHEQQATVDLADVGEVREHHQRHELQLFPIRVLVVARLVVHNPRSQVVVVDDEQVGNTTHPHILVQEPTRAQISSDAHLVLA